MEESNFAMNKLLALVDIDAPIDNTDWELLAKASAEVGIGAQGVIMVAGIEALTVGVAMMLRAAYLLGKKHGGLTLMVAPEMGANVSNN